MLSPQWSLRDITSGSEPTNDKKLSFALRYSPQWSLRDIISGSEPTNDKQLSFALRFSCE
jgi:hypothetical protein